MTAFTVLSYRSGSGNRAGLGIDDRVVDLRSALERHAGLTGRIAPDWGNTVLSVLEHWTSAETLLAAIAEASRSAPADWSLTDASWPVDQVQLAAPIVHPGTVFCAAANYTDHMKEMSGRQPPDKSKTRPFFFSKSSAHTVIGPEEPILTSATSDQLDWEAEIGVVIGAPAFRVSPSEAMGHVAGYTILNDLTLRDQTQRSDWNFGNDWFRGKSFDASVPMGPWITPASAIADPHALGIRLWVNDELMQDSSSRHMHFSIPELIAYLSEQLTLLPGDVIATGTPAGVGKARGRYLQPGDRVTITVEGLGTLANPVVEHAAPSVVSAVAGTTSR